MRFLTAPVCVLFASALAGAKAQHPNMLKTIGFYDTICVCSICARNANILETERKSNKKRCKCSRKTPCHGSSKKKATKAPFWEPKSLQKMTPEASGSALDASCARLPRQELSKSALGGLQRRKKNTPGRKFQRNLQKVFFEADSVDHWSAVLARPVKAYPGGFRPGKS